MSEERLCSASRSWRCYFLLPWIRTASERCCPIVLAAACFIPRSKFTEFRATAMPIILSRTRDSRGARCPGPGPASGRLSRERPGQAGRCCPGLRCPSYVSTQRRHASVCCELPGAQDQGLSTQESVCMGNGHNGITESCPHRSRVGTYGSRDED